MARTMFREKILNFVHDMVILEGNFVVGSTGAVETTKGSGIDSVERLGVGTYRVNLGQTYNRLLSTAGGVIAPTTGSPVAAGSLNPTTVYRITTLGTSDFTAVGAKVNAVGEVFVASGTTTGTGTATAMGVGSTMSLQLCSAIPDNASHYVFQCVDAAGAVAEASAGSVIGFTVILRRGSITGEGE